MLKSKKQAALKAVDKLESQGRGRPPSGDGPLVKTTIDLPQELKKRLDLARVQHGYKSLRELYEEALQAHLDKLDQSKP